jgi:hypothetical protein
VTAILSPTAKRWLHLSELAGLVVARRPPQDDGDLGDDRRFVVVPGSVRPGIIRDTAAVSDAGSLLGELERGALRLGENRRFPSPGDKVSRTGVSAAFAASFVCMSRQKPQPLIWLARIFISSWVAAGRAESTAALFAETRYFTTFAATSLVMMSSLGSMVVSVVVVLLSPVRRRNRSECQATWRPHSPVRHFVEQARVDATTGRLTPWIRA